MDEGQQNYYEILAELRRLNIEPVLIEMYEHPNWMLEHTATILYLLEIIAIYSIKNRELTRQLEAYGE